MQPSNPNFPLRLKTEKTPNKTQRARRKQNIPHAIRWQVWLNYAGEHFQAKCSTPWCRNIMKVYDFQAGHIQAEAAGGPTTVDNLIPICATCNHSMGTMHFAAWAARGPAVPRCCFSFRWLWHILKAPKPVYPVLPTIKNPTHIPLSNIFIDSLENEETATCPADNACDKRGIASVLRGTTCPAGSDDDKQGDTYHPPPLQPDHSSPSE